MPLSEDGPPPDETAPDDDSAAIDRAFAELIAGYHLTANRPDPLADTSEQVQPQPPVLPDPRPAIDVEADKFIPPPIDPLPRPGLPAVLGWIGIGYAAIFVLLTAVGVRLPAVAGWLAIAGFLGSFAILLTRLPRSRPPGDGARL